MKPYLFLFFVFFQSLFSQSLVINVSCEDKQTYPFIMGNAIEINETNPGVTIEVLKYIEKELNVKFDFKRDQGVRGQKNLQTGKSDMLLFASYKKDREIIGVYPKTPQGQIDETLKAMDLSYVLYTLRDSKLDWDGKNFKNLNGKIGVTKGYSIIHLLKSHGVDISENTSNLGDPRKLIANRIQGFVNQSSKIDPYLKENPRYASKIKKILPPIETKPYFILFSRKFYEENKETAEKIWELTADHLNNPKFKSIIKKYE